jgi:hypothetical protein
MQVRSSHQLAYLVTCSGFHRLAYLVTACVLQPCDRLVVCLQAHAACACTPELHTTDDTIMLQACSTQ